MRLRTFISLLVITGILRVTDLRAEIPGAKDPNAYTERDYRKVMLDFYLRTSVEPYKQIGKRDPKWDAQAIAFLDGAARYMANSRLEMMYAMPGAPSATVLEKTGREAIDAGCDDPLVLDLFSLALREQRKMDEMTPILRKAVEGLATSKYPAHRIANAARRAVRTANAEPDLRRKYDQILYDNDLASLKLKDLTGVDRRVVYMNISVDVQNWPVDRQAALYNDLKQSNADAWLTNMVGGQYHVAAGWAARGTGGANTVTEQGWQKLSEELGLARMCINDAYTLEPKYPEAATLMITVAKGTPGTGPPEDLRLWFDRAVAGQLDYEQAYYSYLDAILPRWYGSHPQMFDLALQCADTERYDTRVPTYLVIILNQIREDANGDWAFWKQPNVLEKVEEVITHYADMPGREPKDRLYLYSQLAGYAWQVGKFEIAAAALKKIDGKHDSEGLTDAMTMPARTISGTYAMTGSTGAGIAQAEKDIGGENKDQGLAAFKSIVEQAKNDDPAAMYMRGRYQEILWQQQFAGSDWVNLLPQQQRLDGWYAVSGDFNAADNQSITGTIDSGGASLICGSKFGRRWELSATIEIPPGAEAGVVFGWASAKRNYGITFRPTAQQAVWHFDGQPDTTMPGSVKSQTTVNIRFWEGKVEIVQDNQILMPFRPLWPLSIRPDNRIGFNASGPAGTKFKISEIKIRRLKEEPM